MYNAKFEPYIETTRSLVNTLPVSAPSGSPSSSGVAPVSAAGGQASTALPVHRSAAGISSETPFGEQEEEYDSGEDEGDDMVASGQVDAMPPGVAAEVDALLGESTCLLFL